MMRSKTILLLAILSLAPSFVLLSQKPVFAVCDAVTNAISRNLDYRRGTSWTTCNGYKFIFQSDGNVVLYNSSGVPLWATGTEGSGVNLFSIQADGNVVLYDGSRPVWASDTSGSPGNRFVVQADGNVAVYKPNGQAIFNTGTYGGRRTTFSASRIWLDKRYRESNSLFANPTSANPLKGFKDPLDGNGSYSATHPAPQQYADDLGTPVGTAVKVMRSGRIIEIKQDVPDTLSGPAGGPSNQLNVNYVLIEHDQDGKHSSGKFYRSLYLHLQRNSVRFRVGDRVYPGDVLANSGNNGWTTGPHLHIDVNYSTGSYWYQRQTVPYIWENGRNK
jgi:hypothetical protein